MRTISLIYMCTRSTAVRAVVAAAVFGALWGCAPTRPAQTTTGTAPADSLAVRDSTAASKAQKADSSMSKASQLLIKACDNYLAVNPGSPKGSEVMSTKALIYYKNRRFAESRAVYQEMITAYPGTPDGYEAVRMVANSFYEEKRFDEAQEWYRKLKDMAGEGGDREEADSRIAESIFRIAESQESQSNFKTAAEQYERVALEFPESKIADVALYNAGLSYEKLTEWSHAILVFQRLQQRYTGSKLQPKAMFRIAKCYEKLTQRDNAGEMYLRIVASYPRSELAPVSLYNAGVCFEDGGKLTEAAATFEKLAQLYPSAEDAADVLFRAGEIYGKIKDWESVSRVNQQFTARFGNDADRVVQALCMGGIALYMQNKESEAVDQLQKATGTYAKIKNPSTVNAFYAAKAQFTIGEIYHNDMGNITLGTPRSAYKKQLNDKSDLLERAVDAYGKTIKYSISEWTTRAIYQVGQAYEDFALGIFKQERPGDQSIDDRLSLELGIAQAVEKYFIEKALHFHEQNVKLGLKEKIEDKYILQSRRKLTYLPYLAGENYLTLADISKSAEAGKELTGFALIGRKLQLLQKIGPYQERAIDLFLKCLELGTTYQEFDDFYKKASMKITGISLVVGETYADVATIAREAPVPDKLEDYEKFVYKTKLLKQIEGYEDQALTNYLKTLKISEAYKIEDESVRLTRERIAQVLFTRGRCYDLLCINAFSNPPYPGSISDAEKEEYKARFEEIGLKFQEQAFEIYKTLLGYARQNYAAGEFLTHAYVRLYQNFPDEYGVEEESMTETAIASGPQWKCSVDSAEHWSVVDFDDAGWKQVQKAVPPKEGVLTGIPGKIPTPMWFGTGTAGDPGYIPAPGMYFRRTFMVEEMPHAGSLYLSPVDTLAVFINGTRLGNESSTVKGGIRSWDVLNKLKTGKNVLAVHVKHQAAKEPGLIPLLTMNVNTKSSVPRVPGSKKELTPEEVRNDVYRFPFIKNFSTDEKQEAKR